MTELRERGFANRPAGLGARIEERVSGPDGPMTDRDRADVERLVERGFARWLSGDFAATVDESCRASPPATGRREL